MNILVVVHGAWQNGNWRQLINYNEPHRYKPPFPDGSTIARPSVVPSARAPSPTRTFAAGSNDRHEECLSLHRFNLINTVTRSRPNLLTGSRLTRWLGV